MIKFNKVFNSKVISLALACVFLFTNITYGIDLSERSHLRKPLDFNGLDVTPRYLCMFLAAAYHNSLKQNLSPGEALRRVMEEIDKRNTKELGIKVAALESGIRIYHEQGDIDIIANDDGTFGPKQEEHAEEPKKTLISGHGSAELDSYRLQELKGRIFDEIDRSIYSDAVSLNGRIEAYKDFVLSQAKRLGIRVENKTPGIFEYNKAMIESLAESLRYLFSELMKGNLKRATRTLATVIAFTGCILFQTIPPMSFDKYNANGEQGRVMWSGKGRILYPTNIAVLGGIGVALGVDWGFTFLIANLFEWIVVSRMRVEGHELSHVYQTVVVERVRQELAGNKVSPKAFAELVPIAVRQRPIDTYPRPLSRDPPSKKRLKTIVEGIFEELTRYTGLATQGAIGKPAQAENIKGTSPTSALIGKYELLTNPVFDEASGTIRFMGRSIDTGRVEEITLNATRVHPEAIKQILSKLPQTDNNAVNKALAWFNSSFQGQILLLEDNTQNIFGLGTSELIAINTSFLNNPVALLHEIAESAINAGVITTEEVISSLQDSAWYDAHIAKGSRENLKSHYALRALQREMFQTKDRKLTQKIKALQKSQYSTKGEPALAKPGQDINTLPAEQRELTQKIEEMQQPAIEPASVTLAPAEQSLAQGPVQAVPSPALNNFFRDRMNTGVTVYRIIMSGESVPESDSERRHRAWAHRDIECAIDNVLPVVNPNGNDLTVYYPAAGFDIAVVLASTDATTLIYTDLIRDFMGQGRIDNFAALIKEIESMGGEITSQDIPPLGQEGRCEIKFKLSSKDGKLKVRTLIYYSGVDAEEFVPQEIDNGYDVLWVATPDLFISLPRIHKKLFGLLKEGGFAVFGAGGVGGMLGHTVERIFSHIQELQFDESWRFVDINEPLEGFMLGKKNSINMPSLDVMHSLSQRNNALSSSI